MSTLNKMKFLGNKLNKIKDIFHYCQKNGGVDTKVRGAINQLIPGTCFSWFSKVSSDFDSLSWHLDSVEPGYNSIILAAYPNPTQILDIDECLKLSPVDDIQQIHSKGRYYTECLEKGLARMIQLNPGDVWQMPANTVHRTNPLALNELHLVIRSIINDNPSGQS